MTRAEVGATVVHRRYVPYTHAHYAGHLVDREGRRKPHEDGAHRAASQIEHKQEAVRRNRNEVHPFQDNFLESGRHCHAEFLGQDA